MPKSSLGRSIPTSNEAHFQQLGKGIGSHLPSVKKENVFYVTFEIKSK